MHPNIEGPLLRRPFAEEDDLPTRLQAGPSRTGGPDVDEAIRGTDDDAIGSKLLVEFL